MKAWSKKCLAALQEFLATKKREALRLIGYHEETRRCTKPCGGFVYKEGAGKLYDFIREGPLRAAKTMRMTLTRRARWGTKGREAIRRL